MDIQAEMAPCIELYTLMSNVEAVVRGFYGVLEGMGRGEELRQTLRQIEQERVDERRRALDELGDAETRRN